MHEIDFNFYSVFISLISLGVAIYACRLTSKTINLSNQANVSMYLVSTKKGVYVKVKNFGNSNARLISFGSDVDVMQAGTVDKFPFPLVGLKDIHLAPGTSKVALINKKYLNNGHWISVTYQDDLTKKEFSFKLDLNTYSEYALIAGDDFNLVDY